MRAKVQEVMADSSDHLGKTRQTRKNTRVNPYHRKSAKTSIDSEDAGNKSIIGKVTSYIVPSWISGWLGTNKPAKENLPSSDDETSNDGKDNLLSDDNIKINHTYSDPTSQFKNKEVKFKSVSVENKDEKQNFVCTSSESKISTEYTPVLVPHKRISSLKTVDVEGKPFLTNSSPELSSFIKLKTRNYSATSKNKQVLEKPAFRVSAFVSPDEQYSFNTSIKSATFDFRNPTASPFYMGQTVYGGSTASRDSSVKRQKLSPVSNKFRTTRTQVSAKPLRVSKRSSVTSDTAKRILDTLNKMSAPLKDSKLVTVSRLNSTPSFSKQLRKTQVKTPSSYDKPPVSFNITSVKSNKQIPIVQHIPSLELKSKILPITLSEGSKQKVSDSGSFKMKREKTSVVHYSNKAKEANEIVNLVSEVTTVVPFTINSLPTFSFGVTDGGGSSCFPTFTPILKVKNGAISSFTKTCANETVLLTQETQRNCDTFSFTPSHKISTESSVKGEDREQTTGFKFTSPGILGSKMIPMTPINNFAFSSPVSLTDSKASCNKEELILIKNSTPDVPKQKLNITQSLAMVDWECSVCTTSNEKDVLTCGACGTSKPSLKDDSKSTACDNSDGSSKSVFNEVNSDAMPSSSESVTLTSAEPIRKLKVQQQLADDEWECPTCMISNKSNVVSCIACTEKKPAGIANMQFNSLFKPNQSTNTNLNFPLRQLKIQQAPPDIWECPMCMINNKNSSLSCVACSEKKPGVESTAKGFSASSDHVDSSSKPLEPTRKLNIQQGATDDWECPTCMISNKKDVLACAACQEKKPETYSNVHFEPISCGFSFGSQPSITLATTNTTINSGFSFQNNVTISSSGFSFGSNKSSSIPGFSFKNSVVTTSSTPSAGFLFSNSVATTSDSGFFPGSNVTTTTTSGFSFGSNIATVKTTPVSSEFSFRNDIQTTAPACSGFSFRSNDATVTTVPANIGFSFGSVTTTGAAHYFGNKITDSSNKASFSFGLQSRTTEINESPTTQLLLDSKQSSTPEFSFGTVTPSTNNSFGVFTTSSDNGFHFDSASSNTKKDLLCSSSTSKSTCDNIKKEERNHPSVTVDEKKPTGFIISSNNVRTETNSVFGKFAAPIQNSAGFTFGTGIEATSLSFTKPSANNLFASTDLFATTVSSHPPSGLTFGSKPSAVEQGFAFSKQTENPFCFGVQSTSTSSIGASNSAVLENIVPKNATSFIGSNEQSNNSSIFSNSTVPSFLTNASNEKFNVVNSGFNFSASNSTVHTDFNFNKPTANVGNLFNMGKVETKDSVRGPYNSNNSAQQRVIRRAARRTKR